MPVSSAMVLKSDAADRGLLVQHARARSSARRQQATIARLMRSTMTAT